MTIILLLCILLTISFASSFYLPHKHTTNAKLANNYRTNNILFSSQQVINTLKEPNFEDMKVVAAILANITDHINTNPGYAMRVVTDNMSFLYTRNIPILTQMLLKEYPELKQDKLMLNSFMFLIDFLEAVTKETTNLLSQNRDLLRLVLESAKTSESKFEEVIMNNKKKVSYMHIFITYDYTIYF